MDPIEQLKQWLLEETNAGAPNPQQAVLGTATKDGLPHARVVAIREINNQGLLFFTQKNTRKVSELLTNPKISLVFWFELLQREVIIEGDVTPLSDIENAHYWQSYPREAQIRFYSYAPTSTHPLSSRQELEDKKSNIEIEYQNKELPPSNLYCGFRIQPSKLVFYAYLVKELSHVVEYFKVGNHWNSSILSP